MFIGSFIQRFVTLPTALDYTKEIVERPDCRYVLDVGCGDAPRLRAFRPGITTVGIDAFPQAIEEARRANAHDAYVLADVVKADPDEILAQCGGRKFDLITLYGVIEHLPKKLGFELLEKCEQLTDKYILLETPNGFVEQGPEFGNEYQRHLSGWFPHDFQGLGYKIYGTTGTKYLLGYAARPKYNIRGFATCDAIAARLLRAHKHFKHAFNLVAIKDLRGVPARLG
jgi:2-polyprenyl-3-methyl-5-hydroxy-6-metoxy-1,4-benzoquinol methylase